MIDTGTLPDPTALDIAVPEWWGEFTRAAEPKRVRPDAVNGAHVTSYCVADAEGFEKVKRAVMAMLDDCTQMQVRQVPMSYAPGEWYFRIRWL